jgi:NAD(P)-dependent dehydrogenase (short-subunit alcohol dehydrogenase family)
VTGSDPKLGSMLVSSLGEAGVRARWLETVPPDAGAVIFLGCDAGTGDASAAAAVSRAAFAAARSVAKGMSARGGVFVTVQDTGGNFGLSGQPAPGCWSGAPAALARTLQVEWPRARVRAIDLERGGRPPSELGGALLEELRAPSKVVAVGLRRDGRRTTIGFRTKPAARGAGTSFVDSSSVLVASGGAHGITASCLIRLARERKPKAFALLGRTPLLSPAQLEGLEGEEPVVLAEFGRRATTAGENVQPRELRARARRAIASREALRTLASLRSAGSEADYFVADVRDEAALRAAIASVRERWGAVTGLVHGAGVLADRRVADKTPEQFSEVYSTKVDGLERLLAATRGEPLRVLCLFSSMAACIGNPGQSDYAMANEVLNGVARHEARRRGKHCLVKSFNWGPWEGGMVTPELKAHFEARGASLIPLEAGSAFFVEELVAGDIESVSILVGDPWKMGEE